MQRHHASEHATWQTGCMWFYNTKSVLTALMDVVAVVTGVTAEVPSLPSSNKAIVLWETMTQNTELNLFLLYSGVSTWAIQGALSVQLKTDRKCCPLHTVTLIHSYFHLKGNGNYSKFWYEWQITERPFRLWFVRKISKQLFWLKHKCPIPHECEYRYVWWQGNGMYFLCHLCIMYLNVEGTLRKDSGGYTWLMHGIKRHKVCGGKKGKGDVSKQTIRASTPIVWTKQTEKRRRRRQRVCVTLV